ncbi:hypothetical protein T492DRAFT_1101259 [Pavlovales sp. CCMP2436]|nr:hypothetical protein T492DRAFT_1101259 [Pavlovales sp. CCMP2436]
MSHASLLPHTAEQTILIFKRMSGLFQSILSTYIAPLVSGPSNLYLKIYASHVERVLPARRLEVARVVILVVKVPVVHPVRDFTALLSPRGARALAVALLAVVPDELDVERGRGQCAAARVRAALRVGHVRHRGDENRPPARTRRARVEIQKAPPREPGGEPGAPWLKSAGKGSHAQARLDPWVRVPWRLGPGVRVPKRVAPPAWRAPIGGLQRGVL